MEKPKIDKNLKISAPTGKELTKGQMITKKIITTPKRIMTNTGYMIKRGIKKVIDADNKVFDGAQKKTRDEFKEKFKK